MKSSSVDHRVRRAARQVEALEVRTLLSATVVSQIPGQDVQTSVGSSTINLGTYLNDPQITGGTVVEIQTSVGNIPLQLTDSVTPQTVANFVQYITSGEYANTIIHRSIPGFVIQGGGFYSDGTEVQSFGNIPSEAGQSNVTGTIAVALSNGPDTGNTNWFINLANNTSGQTDLDSTIDGGPFTVFGNVIDGGMTVVNTIAGLQTVNDQQNGAFTNLPVQNYSGSTTPSTVAAANMINTISVVIPADQAAPQFSVVSSDPSTIGVSVSGGVLTLTPGAGLNTGSAMITATVTDLAGETASSSFIASINGFDQPVTIGTGAAKSATYTDDNGTIATLSLKGPGSAIVDFHSSAAAVTQTTGKQGVTIAGSGISIPTITTTGTTSASVLTITTRNGTRTINIGTVTTQDLKTFSAKDVSLTGSLSATGSIGAINLNSAAGGVVSLVSAATISASQSFADNLTLTGTGMSLGKFSGGAIAGGSWSTGGSVKSISASAISGWTAQFGGAVTTLASKGDFTATINAPAIGTIKAGGNLASSIIQLNGTGTDVKNVSVGGSISSSTINGVGSIGSVTAGSLAGSQIYAGIGPLAENQILPNVPTDFATSETIGSVRLKTASGDAFTNSDIAALSLGKLSLGTVQTSNGGQVTGIASENIRSFIANIDGKKVPLKNVTLSTDISTVLTNLGVSLGDFVIKLF